jgi:hypothetical protein
VPRRSARSARSRTRSRRGMAPGAIATAPADVRCVGVGVGPTRRTAGLSEHRRRIAARAAFDRPIGNAIRPPLQTALGDPIRRTDRVRRRNLEARLSPRDASSTHARTKARSGTPRRCGAVANVGSRPRGRAVDRTPCPGGKRPVKMLACAGRSAAPRWPPPRRRRPAGGAWVRRHVAPKCMPQAIGAGRIERDVRFSGGRQRVCRKRCVPASYDTA